MPQPRSSSRPRSNCSNHSSASSDSSVPSARSGFVRDEDVTQFTGKSRLPVTRYKRFGTLKGVETSNEGSSCLYFDTYPSETHLVSNDGRLGPGEKAQVGQVYYSTPTTSALVSKKTMKDRAYALMKHRITKHDRSGNEEHLGYVGMICEVEKHAGRIGPIHIQLAGGREGIYGIGWFEKEASHLKATDRVFRRPDSGQFVTRRHGYWRKQGF